MTKLVILLLFVTELWAEEPKPTIHSVSEKARGDFWKTALLASQADNAKLAADNNKLAAVEAMKKECGDWELQQDPQTLEPICKQRPLAPSVSPPAGAGASQASPVSGARQ